MRARVLVVDGADDHQQAGRQGHRGQHAQRDAAAADTVGQPAAVDPRHRAQQRADEGQLGGVQRGMLGAFPFSRKLTCITCPKANEKPIQEPKVAM